MSSLANEKQAWLWYALCCQLFRCSRGPHRKCGNSKKKNRHVVYYSHSSNTILNCEKENMMNICFSLPNECQKEVPTAIDVKTTPFSVLRSSFPNYNLRQNEWKRRNYRFAIRLDGIGCHILSQAFHSLVQSHCWAKIIVTLQQNRYWICIKIKNRPINRIFAGLGVQLPISVKESSNKKVNIKNQRDAENDAAGHKHRHSIEFDWGNMQLKSLEYYVKH